MNTFFFRVNAILLLAVINYFNSIYLENCSISNRYSNNR